MFSSLELRVHSLRDDLTSFNAHYKNYNLCDVEIGSKVIAYFSIKISLKIGERHAHTREKEIQSMDSSVKLDFECTTGVCEMMMIIIIV